MKTRQPANLPTALSTARCQFDRWRSRQPQRTRLPEELWRKAVVLARKHGLNKTASALGLKYYSLKKRIEATDFRKGIDGLARVCREALLRRHHGNDAKGDGEDSGRGRQEKDVW